jgi:hypothetical protein
MFAAVDTGFLIEGGKRQQPGATIYQPELPVKQATKVLEAA